MADKTSLKKRYKRDILIDDVMTRIAKGELAPGERILPIRQLCTHYDVSMRVILEGLTDLVENEILERRPRTGYFVTTKAPVVCRSVVENTPAEGQALAETDLPHFLESRSASGTICIYLSELYPERLAIWQEAINEFSASPDVPRVDLLTCKDGHLEEILASRTVDIVDGERRLLLNHADCFTPFTDLSVVDRSPDDFVAPVTQWLKGRSPAIGVPHTLTLNYLYENKTRQANAGYSASPKTMDEMFSRAKAFEEETGEDSGMVGLVPEALFPVLCQTGILKNKNAANWELNEKRLPDVLETYANIQLRGQRYINSINGITVFMEGKMLYLPHCSYIAQTLQRQANLDWAAIPLPGPSARQMECHLLCLALHREARQPSYCLELIRHLCSPAVQERFVCCYGNIPALKGAADVAMQHEGNPISASVIEQTLKQSVLLRPGESDGQKMIWEVNAIGNQLWRKSLTVDEACRRISFLIEHFQQ